MDYTITQGPLTLTLPTCTRRVSISWFFMHILEPKISGGNVKIKKNKQTNNQFAKTVFMPS